MESQSCLTSSVNVSVTGCLLQSHLHLKYIFYSCSLPHRCHIVLIYAISYMSCPYICHRSKHTSLHVQYDYSSLDTVIWFLHSSDMISILDCVQSFSYINHLWHFLLHLSIFVLLAITLSSV